MFVQRPGEFKKLFDKIEKIVHGFGESKQETVKPDVIFFKTQSTFLGIKVKKDHFVVEYFLDQREDIPWVFKYMQTSKHQVVHLVVIDSPGGYYIAQLIKWMKASYALINKA